MKTKLKVLKNKRVCEFVSVGTDVDIRLWRRALPFTLSLSILTKYVW